MIKGMAEVSLIAWETSWMDWVTLLLIGVHKLCFVYASILCIPFSKLPGKIKYKSIDEVTSPVWITSWAALSNIQLSPCS